MKKGNDKQELQESSRKKIPKRLINKKNILDTLIELNRQNKFNV